MIIACTHDLVIRGSMSLGPALAWNTIVLLDAANDQQSANAQLAQALANLQPNEALCLAAHQSNNNFGDADGRWSWTASQFASVLKSGFPTGFAGPVLIYAVSQEVATFGAELAAALQTAGVLCGGTVYGFTEPVSVVSTPYPDPQELSSNPKLMGTAVKC